VRERLTTLALALAALGMFMLIFVHAQRVPGADDSVPTTADRRDNGLLGVWPAPLLNMMEASVQHLLQQILTSKIPGAA